MAQALTKPKSYHKIKEMFKQILVTVFFFSFISSMAHSAIRVFKPGQAHLTSDFSFYKTTKNFSSEGGEIESLPSGYYYQKIRFSPRIDWNFTRRWSFFASTDLVNATSDNLSFKRTRTGFSDITMGAQYWLQFQKLVLIPEARLVIPITSFEASTDEVFLSDGVYKGYLGANLQTQWGSWIPLIKGFYEYRSEELSHRFHYHAQITKIFPKTFKLSAHVGGFMSVFDDGYTDNVSFRNNYNTRVNGGSFAHHGVNSQKLFAGGWLGFYAGSNSIFSLGYQADLNGKNASKNDTVLLRWEWLQVAKPKKISRDKKRSRRFQPVDPNEEEDTASDIFDKVEQEIEGEED